MRGIAVVVLLSVFAKCSGMVSLFADGCESPVEPGDCLLQMSRFFYNQTNNRCERFAYTGCGGNENNFVTKRGCEAACAKPPDVDDVEGTDDSNNEDDDDFWGRNGDFWGTNDRKSRKVFKPLFRTRLFPSRGVFRPPPFFNAFFNTRNPFGMPRFNFRPFSSPFRRTFKRPFLNMLGSPSSRMSFQSIISKTRQSLGKEIEKTFEMVSKTFDGNGTSVNIVDDGNDIKCAICTRVVKVIEFEMKVLQLSIDSILKLVEFICSFFPMSKAKCDKIIDEIRNMTKYIDQGLSPRDVCINLDMCSNTTLPEGVTKNVEVSFSKTCSPLCNFMKSIQGEKLSKMTQAWNTTQQKLKKFCEDNKILRKCNILYAMMDRSFQQVANVTEVRHDGDNCKCFNRQPVFETQKFDSCLRCKQFEKGMYKELAEVNNTISKLASRVKDLCPLFNNKECTKIVAELHDSLRENNLAVMPNLCNVTGYCQKNEKQEVMKQVKQTFGKLKGIFGEPTDIFSGLFGGLKLKKFSPDCVFCKKCMGDLKETFKSINATNTDNVYPAVKEGFSLYCETKSVGDEYKTVCKKISDGIETVHETISKRGDGEAVCKTLNLC